MKTGKAYAFLDYEAEEVVLIKVLERNRRITGFPDTFSFTIINGFTALDPKREKLPVKIAEAARTAEVYGGAPMSMVGNVINLRPKKAKNLRYIVMAKIPEVTDSEAVEPLGQARANQVTAGRLSTILGDLCERECLAGKRDYLRSIIFYLDSRRRVQRYP